MTAIGLNVTCKDSRHISGTAYEQASVEASVGDFFENKNTTLTESILLLKTSEKFVSISYHLRHISQIPCDRCTRLTYPMRQFEWNSETNHPRIFIFSSELTQSQY